MKLSLKKTLLGAGLTVGGTLFLHHQIEEKDEDRLELSETLTNCADDLGRTACVSALFEVNVPSTLSVNGNSVVRTYAREDILAKAEDLTDEDKAFENFVYITALVCGSVLTVGFQDPKMRRALAGDYTVYSEPKPASSAQNQ